MSQSMVGPGVNGNPSSQEVLDDGCPVVSPVLSNSGDGIGVLQSTGSAGECTS